MDRKALAYSGLLLVSLVIVAVLLNRGMVHAVLSSGDVKLFLKPSPTSNLTILTQPRLLGAELLFPNETSTLNGVQLVIKRTTPTTTATTTLDVFLPVTSTTSTIVDLSNPIIAKVGTGTLIVTVSFSDVFRKSGRTLPSTLPDLCPSPTNPECGGDFKGIGTGAKIIYEISWTPPANAAYVGDYTAELKAHVVDLSNSQGIINSSGLVGFTILPAVDFDSTRDTQTNVTGIDVGWTSALEEDGYVRWATSSQALAGNSMMATDSRGSPLASNPMTATDSRGPLASRINKRTHQVPIQGLQGGDTIFYEIVSGGVTLGAVNSATIASTPLTSPGRALTGKITYSNGEAGRECRVAVRITQKTIIPNVGEFSDKSLPINILSNGGAYSLDIENVRQDPTNILNGNFNQALQWDASSADATIEVTALCSLNEQVTVTLTSANTPRDPSDTTIYIVDVEVPAVPTFSIAASTVAEGASKTLTVSLNPTSTATTTVDYATADGSATAGSDYTDTSGTLIFGPGQASTTVIVPTLQDTLDEANETFTVGLSNGRHRFESQPTTGTVTVTIVDDDISVSIQAATTVDEAAGPATLTVSAGELVAQNVVVTYMTVADGNATADADFDSTTATTTILAGTTSAVATVAIINDTDDELDETFSVKLVSATNATIAPAASSSTVTITDDDVPVVSIEAATAVDEGAGPATLSVTADRPVAQDVVVTYMTVADGNATANVDFTSTTATTTIAAGTTSTTATVAIESDTIDELNETFSVKLVSATNATIDPAASSSTVTITDDDVPVVSIEAGRNVGEELGPVMLRACEEIGLILYRDDAGWRTMWAKPVSGGSRERRDAV